MITEPDAEGKAVCVNITTRQATSETTVTLNVGDHPFISQESVVYYSDADKLSLRTVEEAMKGNVVSFILFASSTSLAAPNFYSEFKMDYWCRPS